MCDPTQSSIFWQLIIGRPFPSQHAVSHPIRNNGIRWLVRDANERLTGETERESLRCSSLWLIFNLNPPGFNSRLSDWEWAFYVKDSRRAVTLLQPQTYQSLPFPVKQTETRVTDEPPFLMDHKIIIFLLPPPSFAFISSQSLFSFSLLRVTCLLF